MTRLRAMGMLMRPVVGTIGLALFGLALLVAMPLFLWHAAIDLVARSAIPQTAVSARVEFEVASIKPTRSDEGPRGISFSPSGRFAWNKMTVKQLIPSAYAGLDFKQIAGGPGWIDTVRYDIAATSSDALLDIAPDGSPRGLFARLRTLLEDRFGLKTHIERRQVAVYALQPATNRVLGARLQSTDTDCGAVVRQMATGRRPEPGSAQLPSCALQVAPGRLRGRAIAMPQVASALSTLTDRPVIDRTELTGHYDLELAWTPDSPGAASGTANGAASAATDAPSIFTAVREQLGLRLEPTRAEVPVLVIDDAHPPTLD